eukprot:c39777_g1_i1.p1 GENE.c39777_g1_i1~~c39777_g1_i1.p1  ORF type:complete len:184 (-),score=31.82 c39777_g1_i1:34-549(-)
MSKSVRLVVQRVSRARLLLDNQSEYAEIENGCVIFVVFMSDVTLEAVEKAATALCRARLFTPPGQGIGTGGSSVAVSGGSPPTSLAEMPAPFDVLIVPQASMGGTLRGKGLQYHGLVAKEHGAEMYHAFAGAVRALCETSEGKRCINGTYGNRQGFEMATDGPHTYWLELP